MKLFSKHKQPNMEAYYYVVVTRLCYYLLQSHFQYKICQTHHFQSVRNNSLTLGPMDYQHSSKYLDAEDVHEDFENGYEKAFHLLIMCESLFHLYFQLYKYFLHSIKNNL